ncbi:hypothetical protein HQ563_00130 [bacterium]|nr:hypothetical protein [bacterium]
MPNGRGRGGGSFGRGFVGRGFGAYGYGGYAAYGNPYFGGGRGNPYSFCRNFPWLPRWWWATPYASQYAGTIPYVGGAYPPAYGYGSPYAPPYGARGQPVMPSPAPYGTSL